MKVLFISYLKKDGFGGGSVSCRRYYDGLKTWAEKEKAELKIVTLDYHSDSFPVEISKSKWKDISARLLGHSSYMFLEWKRMKKQVIKYEPNIIFLGQSRLGFIAKDIRKSLKSCKIIIAVENIEIDYVDGYFAGSNGMLKKINTCIEKKCTWRDEDASFNNCDAIQFLTKRDQKRAHELYRYSPVEEEIVPICLPGTVELTKHNPIRSVVFVGSLGQGTNIEGLTFFINTVWLVNYSENPYLELIVAGNSPCNEIIEMVKNISNCRLISDFSELKDVVPVGSFIIAPILHGAGMKIKVAETLAMGLAIAASDEALVGYEEAEERSVKGAVIRANSPREYIEAIERFLNMTDADLEFISRDHKRIFEDLYSYGQSEKGMMSLLDSCIMNEQPRY